MKTAETQWCDRTTRPGGFTLLELMVVLVIISAMMTVILPYAARSNQGMKLQQECLNVAGAVRYAVNLSMDTKRPTRMVLNIEDRCYYVEIEDEINSLHFQPAGDIYGIPRYLARNIRITDVDGFSIEGKGYYLLLDPAANWPAAGISLTAGEMVRTITINGRRVEIEDSTI